MEREIDFQAWPLRAALDVLLRDRATGGNILWAADPALPGVSGREPITAAHLVRAGGAFRPRGGGAAPPAWLCCQLNNALDERWFGRRDGLPARMEGRNWVNAPEPISFPRGKRWQAYVDSRRLEVRCGEAPILCSRCDAATGEPLPVERRVGLLDRKLRIVGENAADHEAWQLWALRAFQSLYGYEYRGDRLLLARANLLLSYVDYHEDRWGCPPEDAHLRAVAEVISWNLWQMDERTRAVPFGEPYAEGEQLDMFAMLGMRRAREPVACVIKNWRENRTEKFAELGQKRYPMRFDFVIEYPPQPQTPLDESAPDQ